MRTFLAILFLTFASFSPAEEPLPPAPAGYTWQRLEKIESALLKPNGWFFKESKKRETEGFFVTHEDIDKSGGFATGLTLNCIRNLPKTSGQSPSAYAASFANAAATKHLLIEKSSAQKGPFRAISFRYVDAATNKESVTIHTLLAANDKTGTLFMILFEAPTKNWTTAWKTGEPMLKKLLLNDEI